MAKRPKKKSSPALRRPVRSPVAPASAGPSAGLAVAGGEELAPPVADEPAPSPAPVTRAAGNGILAAPAALPRVTQSFLPTRSERVTSRAERRRQQEAALVPLDETPAIPADRVPFIGSDLRRIGVVALVMVVCIIVGTIVFR
ncbi:MAG TPA: hypothetical protein VMW47_10535 [Verrucomicrobiae bacterium]|nr:hypothetical protein [Verrucomicrobiae bacterium]